MNTGGIPKQILQILCYQSREQRLIGCPVKRWEENMRP
jgi:hypothetical protein